MNTVKKSLVLSCLVLPMLSFSAETKKTESSIAAASIPHPTTQSEEESTIHTAVAATAPSAAQSKEALAKASQNPLASMISLPFQNNTNFNVGPDNQTQNVLLVQPVIPFSLNEDWNLIQRTIIPVTTQPDFITGDGTNTGIGNTQVVAYFSPKEPFHGVTWGVSPVLMLPASNTDYGSKEWGYGLSAVALTMPGKWVIGGLVTQLWAPSGDNSAQINSTAMQYFINYNFSDGWYASTAPTMTYNSRAAAGDRWLVPVGAGGGKVFHWGKQAMNFSLRAYKNVVKPTGNSSDWTLQTQLTFMFPK